MAPDDDDPAVEAALAKIAEGIQDLLNLNQYAEGSTLDHWIVSCSTINPGYPGRWSFMFNSRHLSHFEGLGLLATARRKIDEDREADD